MAHEKLIEEIARRRAKALEMGGPEKLARIKARGHMNARQRIDYLLDAESFLETGMHAFSIREETRHKSPGDGKLAGFGQIAGRDVALVSNDFTVLGASSSQINMKMAKKPMIWFLIVTAEKSSRSVKKAQGITKAIKNIMPCTTSFWVDLTSG